MFTVSWLCGAVMQVLNKLSAEGVVAFPPADEAVTMTVAELMANEFDSRLSEQDCDSVDKHGEPFRCKVCSIRSVWLPSVPTPHRVPWLVIVRGPLCRSAKWCCQTHRQLLAQWSRWPCICALASAALGTRW